MRLRDTQRQKVYDWENAQFNDDGSKHVADEPQMELAEIKKLVTKVARDYGLTHRKVKVADGRGRRAACYSSGTREVKFPRWSRRRYIVMHELAHWIEWVKHPELKTAAHGREFVGIYMELLRRYDNRDLDQMMQTARDARLDFVPNRECTARYLKKHGLNC